MCRNLYDVGGKSKGLNIPLLSCSMIICISNDVRVVIYMKLEGRVDV